MYYIGLGVFGRIALLGAFFLVRPVRRTKGTLMMFACFRQVLLDSQHAYWLIIAGELVYLIS